MIAARGTLTAQLAAAVTIALALIARHGLQADHDRLIPWLVLAAAGIALAVIVRGNGRGQRVVSRTPPASGRRLLWLLAAVLLLAGSVAVSLNNAAPVLALVLWACSLAAATAAAAGKRASAPAAPGSPWSSTEIAALGAIVVVAGLARTLWIEEVPPYIFGDEPRVGVYLMRTFPHKIENFFSIGWNTWPVLGLSVQGLFTPLIGLNTKALRLSSALMGTLSVLATYLLAREMFDRRHAFIAAVIFAVCRTAVDFSRLGICHAQVMFAQTLAFYFWWRAVRTGAARSYLGAGIFMGLCYYTYNAGQIALPLWVAWVVVCVAAAPRTAALYWRSALIVLGGFVLATLPLLVQVTDHFTFGSTWEQWTYLSRNRQSLSHLLQTWNASGAAATWNLVRSQVWITWLGFTVLPSGVYMLGYRGGGMLDQVSGPLFVLGLLYAVCKLRHPARAFVVLWWAATTLVGGILTEGAPAFVRLIGILPALALLAAAPLRLLLAEGGVRRLAGAGAIGALLLALAWENYQTYFVRFPLEEFDPMSELVAFSKKLPPPASAALLGAEHYLRYTRREIFDLDLPGRPFRDVDDVANFLPYRQEADGSLALILGPTQKTLSRYARELYPTASVSDVIRGRDRVFVFRTLLISPDALLVATGLQLTLPPAVEGRPADPFGPEPHPMPEDNTAVWHGSIYWPTWEPARLEIETSRQLSVELGAAKVQVEAGGAAASITLRRGWYPITLREQIGAQPRHLAMKITTGTTEWQLTRRDFRPDSTPMGLEADFTRGGEVIARTIEPQVNLFAVETLFEDDPASLRAPFRVRWRGILQVDTPGTYTLETYATGPHRISVDQNLILKVPEVNPDEAQTNRAEIELAQGFHPVAVTYDGTRRAHTTRRAFQLFWAPPGGERELVPPTNFRPPQTTSAPAPTLPGPE